MVRLSRTSYLLLCLLVLVAMVAGCVRPAATPVPISPPAVTQLTPTPTPAPTSEPTRIPTLAPTPSPPLIRAADAVGEQKTIVILVEFPDVRNRFSSDQVHRQVFVELNDYIKEVSYGKTWLTGDTTKKWYILPKKSDEYGVGPSGLENRFIGDIAAYFRTLIALVSDTINLADGDVDFSRYRRALIVTATSVGGGACGPLGGLQFITPSGKSVRGSAWVTPGAHSGVFAHEFIHQLGGYEEGVYFTPLRARNLSRYRKVAVDLYDLEAFMTRGDWHGFQYYPKYIGPWDVMGFHAVDRNRPPAGPSSFTKLRLGWIAEPQVAIVKPGDLLTLKVDPLELPTSGTQVVKIPLTSNTYYLIENRQQVGYDSVLPSSGVLIYYADETIKEGYGILKLVNANSSVPEFKGAAFDIGLGRNDTFVDKENGWTLRLLKKEAGYYTVQIDATKLGLKSEKQ